jgi:diguanylate cyclase (GGDEF)-like protein
MTAPVQLEHPRGTALRERPARVLVADDDPVTRGLVSRLMHAEGYDVVEACTGREAVHCFQQAVPDLVLLDVQMPDGDGFEVCAALRALDPRGAVPIVMLTARDDVAAIAQAFRLHATDFITKPFASPLLQQRVRYALRSRGLDREVRRSRERQAMALRMARVMFWDMDLRTDTIAWSCETLPLDGDPVTAPSTTPALLDLFTAGDTLRLTNALTRAHATCDSFDLELRLTARHGGHVVRLLGGSSGSSDGSIRVSGALQDVSAARRHEALAEFLTRHDELTGISNRRGFSQELDALLETVAAARTLPKGDSATGGSTVLVGWLDITRFQRVNDALGEPNANVLLARLGRRIRSFVDEPDLVGRVSGDEFAVALRASDPELARLQFEALLLHLQEPLAYLGGETALSWSAGVALAPTHGTDAPALLAAAEAAQRTARASGRLLSIAPLDASRPGRAALLIERESALRRALAQQEFRMVVQPQLDAQTQRIVGVETLLRWRDADGCEVPPEEFVPMLEENGLIVPVGAWCLREACRWQRRWAAEGLDLRIAVNVSPRQFSDPRLFERITTTLAETQVPADRLELELTESLAMQRPEYAIEVLSALRDRGVLIAIDDFGVGYSSLSRLVHFPIDTIKLDRGFTADLLHSRPVEAVMRAAVAIADSLGLTTIAEGVELQAQAVVLRDLGLTELQGFHIGRPMPPEALVAFVKARDAAGRASAA